MRTKKPIEDCIREHLENYFKDIEGMQPTALYGMLLKVVERPLLEVVLQRAENNQSRAAQWLGMNRNTLHRKLQEHKLI